MASRNRFSALDLESDSAPEFDPEPLSRSHFGGEPTVPLYFGTFELEQTPELEDKKNPSLSDPKPLNQLKQNHQLTILVLKKESEPELNPNPLI